MKIELKPCYPAGSTREEQIEYIKGEFKELMDAIDNENWENQAKETLDVVQTIVGYMDIVETTGEAEVFDTKELLFHNESKMNDSDTFDVKPKLNKYLSFFLDKVEKYDFDYMNIITSRLVAIKFLAHFYGLICEHDRGCKKYRQKLLERFLDEHEAKLDSRRKEWANDCS